MTDQAAPPNPSPVSHDDSGPRSVTRRRNLPGGRAVVGAFLVTAAAVGIFTAYLRANAAPTTEYLVAAHELLPGDVLTSQDMRAVAIDLPGEQVATTASNRQAMEDRVVLSPMTEGELFGLGDTADPADVEGTSAVTVPMETSRALNGDLDPGDRVDVVATFDDTTRYVAVDLEVVQAAVEGTSSAVTLAAPDAATVIAVTNAIDLAEVFLARSNPAAGLDGNLADAPTSSGRTPPDASEPSLTGPSGGPTDEPTATGGDDG